MKRIFLKLECEASFVSLQKVLTMVENNIQKLHSTYEDLRFVFKVGMCTLANKVLEKGNYSL